MLAAASLMPIVSAPALTCADSVRDSHLRGEVHQVVDEGRVVDDVGHDPVEATQLLGEGQRSFDPAHDRNVTAQFAFADLDRPDSVLHAAFALRVWHRELVQPGLVEQRRPLLEDHRALVLEPLDAVVTGDVDHLARSGPSTSIRSRHRSP